MRSSRRLLARMTVCPNAMVSWPNDSADKFSAEPKSHRGKVNRSFHGDLDGRFR